MSKYRWGWGSGHRDHPSEPVFNIWVDDRKRQFSYRAVEMIVLGWGSGYCEVPDIKGRTVNFHDANIIQGYTKEPNYDVDRYHHNYRDGACPPEIVEELTDKDRQKLLASMLQWLEAHPPKEGAS